MLLRISTSCVAPEGLGCDVRARSATVTELACSPAPRIPWACAGPTVHLVFTHQKNTGPRVRPSQHTRHITTPARTRDDGDLGSFSTTTQGIACFAGLLTIGSCAADRQPGHRRRPDDGAVRPPVPRTRCLPPFEAVPLAFAAGMANLAIALDRTAIMPCWSCVHTRAGGKPNVSSADAGLRFTRGVVLPFCLCQRPDIGAQCRRCRRWPGACRPG